MIFEIQHFLLVVEHRTFTAASSHAGLSQPALSASIARLEEEVGARLFDRGRKGASLTEDGRSFLRYAQRITGNFARAKQEISALRHLEEGSILIAAGATACSHILPSLIATFQGLYPKIHVRVSEVASESIMRLLEDEDVDLGIIATAGANSNRQSWFHDELIFVSSPTPKSTSIIAFQSGTSRILLRELGLEKEITMEFGSLAAIKAHLHLGMGKALLSRLVVAEDLASGKLIELDMHGFPKRRDFHIQSSSRRSYAAIEFEEHLRRSMSCRSE